MPCRGKGGKVHCFGLQKDAASSPAFLGLGRPADLVCNVVNFPDFAIVSKVFFHRFRRIFLLTIINSVVIHMWRPHYISKEIRGASKIKLKKVNKKRTVRVRRVIFFLNISRHPLLI